MEEVDTMRMRPFQEVKISSLGESNSEPSLFLFLEIPSSIFPQLRGQEELIDFVLWIR
jgi:hypothetical protein